MYAARSPWKATAVLGSTDCFDVRYSHCILYGPRSFHFSFFEYEQKCHALSFDGEGINFKTVEREPVWTTSTWQLSVVSYRPVDEGWVHERPNKWTHYHMFIGSPALDQDSGRRGPQCIDTEHLSIVYKWGKMGKENGIKIRYSESNSTWKIPASPLTYIEYNGILSVVIDFGIKNEKIWRRKNINM